MRTSLFKNTVFLFFIVLISCQSQPQLSAKPPQSISENTNTLPITTTKGTAKIQGKISFVGEIPKLPEINRSADAACTLTDVALPTNETLVVGNKKGIANVVVWIEGFGSAESGLSPVALTQKACTYQPHVIGLQIGQVLQIINADATMHNVHSQSEQNPAFNESQPQYRKVIEKIFTKAEAPFRLKCDVHPWMTAYIFVSQSRFYAVTNMSGDFLIDQLPSGTFTLKVWHEKLGIKSETITVTDGQVLQKDFSFGL